LLFNEFGDRNVWRHGEFKDFQAPVLFSSTFKSLNLGEKKIKYFQGRVGTLYFCIYLLLSIINKWQKSHKTHLSTFATYTGCTVLSKTRLRQSLKQYLCREQNYDEEKHDFIHYYNAGPSLRKTILHSYNIIHKTLSLPQQLLDRVFNTMCLQQNIG